jgi:hypothetical protein
MGSGKREVAVVSAEGDLPADLVGPLTRGGYVVAPSSFNSPPHADAVAVLVLATIPGDAATAFTRRRRADAGSPRPFVWLFQPDAAHLATTGLNAGADVCLVRPVDADLLLAQVNALVRMYSDLTRIVAKGTDTAELSERLGRQFRQTDADADFARQTLAAFAAVSPLKSGDCEAAWVHEPPTSRGVHTLAVVPTPAGVRFALVTVGGLSVPTGAALAEALTRHLLDDVSAGESLTDANRRVRWLGLPDAAVLAATVGEFTPGGVRVACGGHPPPVLVPTDGSARLWHGAGAFLGQSDAGYSELSGELTAGERLLLLGGGAAADKRPDVRAVADERGTETLGELVKRVAGEVFTPSDAAGGYSLLAVGRPTS